MRLKVDHLKSYRSIYEWFQFHKGAIKRPYKEGYRRPLRRFQFHKGAIKSRSFLFEDAAHDSFNSIKVRLKDARSAEPIYARYGFNSIKVRLKAYRSIYECGIDSQFQFHKGAIKSVRLVSFISKVKVCFNSIKVRLKDPCSVVLEEAEYKFQFHKGAIKRRLYDDVPMKVNQVSIP